MAIILPALRSEKCGAQARTLCFRRPLLLLLPLANARLAYEAAGSGPLLGTLDAGNRGCATTSTFTPPQATLTSSQCCINHAILDPIQKPDLGMTNTTFTASEADHPNVRVPVQALIAPSTAG